MTTGSDLRDQGAAAAANTDPAWFDSAVALALLFFVYQAPGGALFEDARRYAYDTGLGEPRSPNAWGSVCLWLSRKGLIERTGAHAQSQDPTSHARMQPLWRSTL